MPYAQSSEGRIHYDLVDHVAPWVDEPETIVFHHGIGASAGIWARWMPRLIDRYRLVVFDMRGYGRSHIPAPGAKWTLDLLVEDLFAVVRASGAGKVHLVGESIGGTIALRTTLRHPELVHTLTISNGADKGAPLQKVHEWQRQIDEQGIKAWSDQFMRDRFYDGVLGEAEHAWYARQQEAWTRDSILGALGVLVGTDLRTELPHLALPVLLMHGDSSPFIPVSVMADMHRALPDARFQVFPRAKHGLPFSHADHCAATLRAFLDSQAAG
ncbi:MAG TPA: alpha/beta hydrolase [Burkholderiales bacterium]|nr:alpha/beta hydrolase [Burkholderiales bacterium]